MSDTITCAQLVARTQRWVASSRRAPLNRLAGAITATAGEISVAYDPGPIAPRSIVAIDDEMLFVWEVDRGSNTLTVGRGAGGTEAVAHDDLADVEAGARFPKAVIKDALQDEIRSWPEDVFQLKGKTIVGTVDGGAYDLGVREDDLNFVLSVARAPVTGGSRWTDVMFHYERFMPRDLFPSGVALFVDERFREAHTLRAVCAVRFDVDDIDDADDVVEDWGLARTMVAIAPVGAAARLLQSAEALRTDTEAMGESRIAAEVPPSYLTNTAVALRRQADKWLRDEAVRLRSRHRMPS